MFSERQFGSLPRPVRLYVFALMRERAWQQIADLLAETPERRLAISTIAINNGDKAGRYFGEISVAKSQ